MRHRPRKSIPRFPGDTRTCTGCLRVKPFTEFPKNGSKAGYRAKCFPCYAAYMLRWREANLDRVNNVIEFPKCEEIGEHTMIPKATSQPRQVFRKLTLREKVSISDLLNVHAIRTPDGFCRYLEGWDDEKIALHLNIPDMVKAVGTTRRQLVGNLAPAAVAPKVDSASEARIASLESEVATLIGRIDVLETNMARMAELL